MRELHYLLVLFSRDRDVVIGLRGAVVLVRRTVGAFLGEE